MDGNLVTVEPDSPAQVSRWEFRSAVSVRTAVAVVHLNEAVLETDLVLREVDRLLAVSQRLDLDRTKTLGSAQVETIRPA